MDHYQENSASAPVVENQPPAAKPWYEKFRYRLPLYLLVAYAAWCTALYFYQDQLVFPADLAPAPLAEPFDRPVVVEKLEFAPGQFTESWFFPAPNASADKPAPLVVYFHGNAELIGQQEHIVDLYHRLGCSVLLPEYRGYGRAAGTPSQVGIVSDCTTLLDRALARPEVDPDRLVIHGRSLGGGVAAQVAAARTPAVMILESTFTSVAAMAYRYGAPAFLARNPFRTDRVLARLDCPLLIFHGTRDRVIPVEHGRKLEKIARHGRYIEYDIDHNDFPGPENERAYRDMIRAFLARHGIIRVVIKARIIQRDGRLPGRPVCPMPSGWLS